MQDAYKTGVMFSLRVKATMMKVSHPVVFGHAVKVFYKDAFAKHQALRRTPGQRQQRAVRPLQQNRVAAAVAPRRIIDDLHECHEHRPELAMVDSARGSPTSTRPATSSSMRRCRR